MDLFRCGKRYLEKNLIAQRKKCVQAIGQVCGGFGGCYCDEDEGKVVTQFEVSQQQLPGFAGRQIERVSSGLLMAA